MNDKYELRQAKQELIIWRIMATTFLFLIIMLLIFLPGNNKNNICYDYVGLNETLENIQKNCHSTFITEHYDKYEWYVFDASDCQGEYCKQTYHKLEDCLD